MHSARSFSTTMIPRPRACRQRSPAGCGATAGERGGGGDLASWVPSGCPRRAFVALSAAQCRRCRVCTQAARCARALRPAGVFRPVMQRRSPALPVNEPPSRRAEGKDPMNSVNLTARLTRDPELVDTRGDTAVCNLRVAIERRGDGAVFLDVKTFGAQASACKAHLSKG